MCKLSISNASRARCLSVGCGSSCSRRAHAAARQQIEKMVGTKVFLELFVKVVANWRESRQFVDELDWRRQLDRLAGNAHDSIQK